MNIDRCLYCLNITAFYFDLNWETSMASLNSCVQEFIAQHSSSLFSSETGEARPTRISRFNSNPLSSTEIEDEDPSTSTTCVRILIAGNPRSVQISMSSRHPSNISFVSQLVYAVNNSSKYCSSFTQTLHSVCFAVVDSSWSSSDLSCHDGRFSWYACASVMLRRWTSTGHSWIKSDCKEATCSVRQRNNPACF